ncbi:MAG: hypothetical protein ACE141_09000 [Bryobacteraceae bacterium]
MNQRFACSWGKSPDLPGRFFSKLLGVAAVAACSIMPIALGVQRGNHSAGDLLLDLLLSSAHEKIDVKAYPPGVQDELTQYLRRYQAYRSQRVRPVLPGLHEGTDSMIYAAWLSYERRLAAASPEAAAPALAREYVDRLRPCYEWEGFHDCPEREAKFATDYQAANPQGPFSHYLPLLIAHRWLCTAEAYQYEKQPEDARRSRQAYEEEISIAKGSGSALVRFAASRLAERNTCHPRR